jgi:hypothetical protein
MKIPDNLQDLAAIYLEDAHISGDAMIVLDHSVPVDKGGSMYLADLMAEFTKQVMSGRRTSNAKTN